VQLESQLKKQQQQQQQVLSKSADAASSRVPQENKENLPKEVSALKVPPTSFSRQETSENGEMVLPPPTTIDDHHHHHGIDAVELGQQVSELEMEVATLRASLAGHERVMREQARENQRLSIVEREAKRDGFKFEETK
jgi:hypothetical protein